MYSTGIHESYTQRARCIDYLIALGTHPILSEDDKLKRVGITALQKKNLYDDVKIMNHRWDRQNTFIKIGTISEAEIEELTEGLLKERAEISINRMIFDYDRVIILGPVFPHEIAGFSGSNKYLFPGICGWDFTDVTHWLGALRTNMKTIGMKDTPQRRLIDRAAHMVGVPLVYFNLVVDREGLKGLFIGDGNDAWEKAVDLSAQLNIIYEKRPYSKILSIPSKKYDDFWTGAKAFYKIEPVVEDGGTIVVYAPHIKDISITHREVIKEVGFHIKDYFVANMKRYAKYHRAVLAYSALVKGAGTFIDDREKPRIKIVLSSAVPEHYCRALNLDYIDPSSIDIAKWENQESKSIKVIHDAGEVLYRLTQANDG